MTKIVIGSVAVGIGLGYAVLPAEVVACADSIIVVGLTALLFLIGIDIGKAGTIVENFKKAGLKILVFPAANILGTLAGALVGSMVISFAAGFAGDGMTTVSAAEALTVGSGFSWYSLAPILIEPQSAELAAMSFMHNVMRELFGIILIPVVAKKIGYIETTALPGAAAMDVCIPIVERTTSPDVAVYSFVMGVVLSICVPCFVPLFLGFIG